MKKDISIGDKYGPAMGITDQAEADAYFQQCVAHTMAFGKSQEEAEGIERGNLGYYAGYYSSETRERIERLFSCAHPIFGAITICGRPSVAEALESGRKLAQKIGGT